MSEIHGLNTRLAFAKAGNRMRETFDIICTALSDGFTKRSSLIDTSDWESHLDNAIGGKVRDQRLVLYDMPSDD